ncbi:ATP-binding protein [Lysobacter sp. CA199]|uniref:ATP-binding protein n=1 Tax=Lysobacter sp. CA199 TaxID=3455608 RepID=UPI003F8CF907
MLPTLAAAQIAGFVISADERIRAIRIAERDEFLMRTASVARLLDTTPSVDHREIVEGMASANIRFWLSDKQPTDASEFRREALARLSDESALPNRANASSGSRGRSIESHWEPASGWHPPPPGDWGLPPSTRAIQVDSRFGTGVVVPTSQGQWLRGAFSKPRYGQIWKSQSLLAISLTAALLSAIALSIGHRIARPVRRLSAAAEALGRGETVDCLPEEGPEDIRRMTAAFNVMQDRLQRFLSDRTVMLAAIGHDLRTPVTSLRLRAEFIEDPDERGRFLATLDDMQSMIESTLSFASEQATGETARLVDVAALAESICHDLTELGREVVFEETERVPYRCRPSALRRAIGNLVENAIRYGGRARIRVTAGVDGVRIVVEDDGPGIPDDDMERVFMPFIRLEASRSRETGGAGLGLAIARTIARSHGGDVILENRTGGGLRATIRLPAIEAAAPGSR